MRAEDDADPESAVPFAFPKDLVELVERGLRARKAPAAVAADGAAPAPDADLPSLAKRHLRRLLEVAYHASFTREETRSVVFSLMVLPDDGETIGAPGAADVPSWMYIPFARSRPFTPGEIRQLAPAADPKSTALAVRLVPEPRSKVEREGRDAGPGLRLTGLVEFSGSWWRHMHVSAQLATFAIPPFLSVSSAEPGRVRVSFRGDTLAELRGGEIASPASDVLSSGPVGKLARAMAKAFSKDAHAELSREAAPFAEWSPELAAGELVSVLSRLLHDASSRAHGGTLLVLPPGPSEARSRALGRLRFKHRCEYGMAWNLLVKLFVLERQIAGRSSEGAVDPDSVEERHRLAIEYELAQDRLTDVLGFIASLSGIDGAVVLGDRLEVLGFGVEILSERPVLDRIRIAEDARARRSRLADVTGYGTRHRSAFRFCANEPEAVAFVFSQDGGVRAVKSVGGEVVMWEDLDVVGYGP